MGEARRRPITFWTCVAVALLFVATEGYWVIREILNPCPGCVDAGSLFPYTAIAFATAAVPILIATLLLDARRNRLRAHRSTPRTFIEQVRMSKADQSKVDSLSNREREILLRVVDGATSQQIATELGIPPHTVKIHLDEIFEKLGAN